MRSVISAVLGLLLLSGPQVTVDPQRTTETPQFRATANFIDKDHDRLVRETIQLCEIEAPPFKEARRAKAFLEMLRQHGLTNVEMDAEGNVMGLRKGNGNGPLIAIAAHLDTVFPEGTNVKVRREGTRLMAPGIGDNSRALAVLLAMIRAMDAAKIQTSSDILFVGNVGEEGPGDLRGIRYLFQKGLYKDRIKAFVSIDGTGPGSDIIIGALGSKRYKVTFKGPGGHSYSSFGIVNPAYAMGNAIHKFSNMQVPARPNTTLNVGVIGGGTSVNSIPFETWMEVDIRSESRDELDKQGEIFQRLMYEAASEENRARSTAQGRIEVEVKLVGDRPSGETPANSPIVRTADAVVRAMGMNPTHNIGSTDSNIPISMKIPAITIDSGGRGGRAHALDEWIDVEKSSSVAGINLGLGILLSLSGMQ